MRFEDMSEAEIMMLPDSVFGRRWWSTASVNASGSVGWAISVGGLPERIVVWNLSVWISIEAGVGMRIGVALSDVVATSLATFSAMERLLPEFEYINGVRSVLSLSVAAGVGSWPMRKPVATGGRRLALEVVLLSGGASIVQVGILVSGFPTGEVPQCYL